VSDEDDAREAVDGRVRRGVETREARRAQILENALAVFAAKGYHETTVSDLVAASGVARGTFYLYFDGKEALFLELLADLLQHVRGNIVGVNLTRGPLEEQLHATIARLLRTVESNRPLTRILFREAVGLHSAVDERLRAFDAELLGYVERSLALGIALGRIRATDPRLSALAVVGSVRELVQHYVVQSDAPFDVDAVARALVDHHLRGLDRTGV
jgi:AcrR family transcriptional regulator